MSDSFTSPFLPKKSGEDVDKKKKLEPNFASQLQDKKYACRLCHRSYRLLGGLVSHYESKHGSKIPEDLYAEYRGLEKIGDASPASTATASPKTESSGKYSEADEAAKNTPQPDTEVNLHIRSACNIHLLGRVVDVKEGFVKSEAVTQLLLDVSEEAADGSPSPFGKDLITVRCFGDDFSKHVKQNVADLSPNAKVLVTGNLKLNRHVDEVSRRSHAYPFVQVVRPLGSFCVIDR